MPKQPAPPPPPPPSADGHPQPAGSTSGSGPFEDTSGVEVSNWADPSCRMRRQCRPRLVGLVGCEHVSLSDVALSDSAFWTLHVRRSRHVSLSGLRVSGNRRFPNNDGIDIDGSAHVTVRNCTVSTADDAVCLKTTLGLGERDPDPGLRALEAAAAKAARGTRGTKGASGSGNTSASCAGRDGGGQDSSRRTGSSSSGSTQGSGSSNSSGDDAACGRAPRLPPPRATEHVLVEDCVLSSRSAAVKLGSESRAHMANITFRRVQVLDSNRGLGIQLRDWGDIRDVLFEDVSVTTSRVTAGRWWGGGEPIYVTALPRHLNAWARVGQLSNVSFRRVAATATGGLVVVAGSPESVVRGVTLEAVTLRILPPPLQPPEAHAIPAASGSAAAVQGPRWAQEAAGAGPWGHGGRAQDAATTLVREAGVRATAPAAGRRLLGTAGPGSDDTGAGHAAAGPAAASDAAAEAAAGSNAAGEGAQGGNGGAAEATDRPLGVKLDLRPGPYDVRRWPLPAAGPLLAQYVQGLALWNVEVQLVAPAPGHTGLAADGDANEAPWRSPPPPRSWLVRWLDWWLARPPPWCVELEARTVHGLQAAGVRVRVVSAEEASGALPVPDDSGAGASGTSYAADDSWLRGRGSATGVLWLGVAAVLLCVVAVTACVSAGLLHWQRRGGQARLLPLPTTDSDDGCSRAARSDGRKAPAGGGEDMACASVWAAAAAGVAQATAAPAAAPLQPLPPTGLRSLCIERCRALGSSDSLAKKTVATQRTTKVVPQETYSTEGV